jgi:hypothetical protein
MASDDVMAITKWSIFSHPTSGSINDFGMVLFAPPTLSERCHRGLARRLVAVRRSAVFVIAVCN